MLLDQYLLGTLSATGLVNAIDLLVSEDRVCESPAAVREAVDAFQDQLALYVHDESTQRESALYFGDTELADKVAAFRTELEKL
ncbi:MAG: hypothetical protein QM784_35315 [Polyangiaceae bacterium]